MLTTAYPLADLSGLLVSVGRLPGAVGGDDFRGRGSPQNAVLAFGK
jgi:hypothetical protein